MNTSTNIRLFGLALVLLTALWTNTTAAQNNEAIGTILVTKGVVQALSADGESRQLSRRSEVFVEDTIVTSPASNTSSAGRL
jgi:hypothetical protein